MRQFHLSRRRFIEVGLSTPLLIAMGAQLDKCDSAPTVALPPPDLPPVEINGFEYERLGPATQTRWTDGPVQFAAYRVDPSRGTPYPGWDGISFRSEDLFRPPGSNDRWRLTQPIRGVTPGSYRLWVNDRGHPGTGAASNLVAERVYWNGIRLTNFVPADLNTTQIRIVVKPDGTVRDCNNC